MNGEASGEDLVSIAPAIHLHLGSEVHRRRFLGTAAAVALSGALVGTAAHAQAEEHALELFANDANHLWNGVAVTEDGRVFVSLPAWLGPTAGVGEIVDGTLRPWPGTGWNDVEGRSSASERLVNVNAIELDPATPLLWVVDAGALPGGAREAGAAKLVGFDLHSGAVGP